LGPIASKDENNPFWIYPFQVVEIKTKIGVFLLYIRANKTIAYVKAKPKMA
jgi:hypothetical protein